MGVCRKTGIRRIKKEIVIFINMDNTKKIYDGSSYDFILENPIKIVDVVRGNHNGKLIIRVLREDGEDKPIFWIQKKDEETKETNK